MIIPEARSKFHPMGESKLINLPTPVGNTTGLIYVNIPKNASCWMKYHFSDNQYEKDDVNYYEKFDAQHHRVIVILRDPLERWISGFCQMISGDHPKSEMYIDNINWDTVVRTVAYDNHTQKQVDFIANIPHENIVWFKFDKDLIENFVDYMLKYNISVKLVNEDAYPDENIFNRTVLSNQRQTLVDRVSAILDNNPTYKKLIQDYYHDDYKLYNSVPYYTK